MRIIFYFARAYSGQTFAMLLAQFMAGLMQGISLTALLPMLNIAVSGGKGNFSSGIGKTVTTGLRTNH
ncbi:MAG: hypothetical protein EG828_02085 [Deltaproteobacteria bacterium]|nr:hypothetical protein [Deltaproteobacteria bacterium]